MRLKFVDIGGRILVPFRVLLSKVSVAALSTTLSSFLVRILLFLLSTK